MRADPGLPPGDRLLSILLPPRCRLCGAAVRAGPALCTGCHHDLPWLGQGCLRCGWPLTGPREVDLCGRCQHHPPVFAATTAALRYRPPADYLIRRLKFAGELALAPLLAELLAERLTRREAPLPECLLPVPLHRSRLRERGFNQATEIARRLGCRLGLPVNRSVCRRVRRTGAQSLLPVSARRKNVRDAFAVTGNPRLRHVALVDDVMTSGHTASELARMLARAGVATIEVWVVARAGR